MNEGITNFLIGGFSAAFSRTCVAPAELFRLQRQNSFIPDSTLRDVIRKEGVRYLWKGNLINCTRAFPQFATNLLVYDAIYDSIPFQNNHVKRFAAGVFSGSVAMTVIYPLETLKSHFALQTNKNHYSSMLDAFKKLDGRALYQGLTMSVIGFGLYSAINMSTYPFFKNTIRKLTGESNDTIINKLVSGGLCGCAAITVTYPTDLMRRRLQLQGFDPSVPNYRGNLDCLVKIIRSEGVRGLYRGLYANYYKTFPAFGIQFWCMDTLSKKLK